VAEQPAYQINPRRGEEAADEGAQVRRRACVRLGAVSSRAKMRQRRS
jgi:hypothetical protein